MKENFAAINFFGDKCRATAIKADFANKKIEISEDFEFSSRNPLPVLKKFFSLVFYPRAYSAIFIFSPKEAAGIGGLISFERLKPKEKISEEELADSVSDAVWKFFDSGRTKAAKQLGLSEPEIMLSDVSVYDFKIDGRKVINPMKQAGKKISLEMGQVFADRGNLKKFIGILPKRSKRAFIMEGGTCASRLLERMSGKQKFAFAKVSPKETNMFFGGKGDLGFMDYFSWGEEDLYRGISDNLKIGVSESKFAAEKALAGETSENFKKEFQKIFLGGIAPLVQGLKAGASAAKAKKIFLDFPFAEKAVSEGLKFKNISTNMIISVGFSGVLEKLGFGLNAPADKKEKADFLLAAAILEIYFSPALSYPLSLVNRLAKRRMMWLMPN
jgi:hypothetical protein